MGREGERPVGVAGSREGGRDGWMEGKPEAPVRGGSVRVDEGSGLCPRVYGAGLDPTKGSG